ncbi:MAG: LexA family transcriptional regulator [Oscillospiraceae bacterium]|jgi:phage repressor protein C with HTH and peptisase S24 domain|nr:LexA family transcriptional regulator [Oscillospiraceae bacterium]
MDKSIFSKNLKELRTNKGLTQKELAKILGISTGAIKSYEIGTREPGFNTMVALERFFGVSGEFLKGESRNTFLNNREKTSDILDSLIEQFLLFKEEMRFANTKTQSSAVTLIDALLHIVISEIIRAENYTEQSVSDLCKIIKYYFLLNEVGQHELTKRSRELSILPQYKKNAPFQDKRIKTETLTITNDFGQTNYEEKTSLKSIPLRLYNEAASAGLGNYLSDNYFDIIEVDISDIPADSDFCVRIYGDSMLPKYQDGNIVFVRSLPALENGQIGIFVLNNDAYCKQLHIDYEHRQTRLVSLNQEYEDIIVQEFDTLRTVGLVTGILT